MCAWDGDLQPPGESAAGTTRSAAVDSLRAVALVGICVVNLPFLGLPLEEALRTPEEGPDRFASLFVAALFQSKFFLLFSFLFGWGLDGQEGEARRRGRAFGGIHARRLAGLAVLGLAHALLVFTGDILLLYALLGALVWPMRRLGVRGLVRAALAMVPVSMGALVLLGLLLAASAPASPSSGLGGSLLEATRYRLATWPGTFGLLLLFQGPMAFGAMLTGLAAARAGFFAAGSPGRARVARVAPWCAAVGVPANIGIALASTDVRTASSAVLLVPVAAPMLAVVWMRVALWVDERDLLPTAWRVAGRNSLTSYVLEGAFAGLLFGGHGAGLFGRFGPAALLPAAVAVAMAAMGTTALLARRGRGPLERLLRAVTYGPSGLPGRPSAGTA